MALGAPQLAYYVGIAIIVLSHLYMLKSGLMQDQMQMHAYINILAAVLIAYGWMKSCMTY